MQQYLRPAARRAGRAGEAFVQAKGANIATRGRSTRTDWLARSWRQAHQAPRQRWSTQVSSNRFGTNIQARGPYPEPRTRGRTCPPRDVAGNSLEPALTIGACSK